MDLNEIHKTWIVRDGEKFLEELKQAVMETDVVKSVDVKGNDITTVFKKGNEDGGTISAVLEASKTLIEQFKEKAKDNKIKINDTEFQLSKDNVSIDIAMKLFGVEDNKEDASTNNALEEKIKAFLGGEETITGDYKVTIVDGDVTFELSGKLHFKAEPVTGTTPEVPATK